MQKPHVKEFYAKEFLRSMQAKGKLPRMVTDASEYKEKAWTATTERLFPGPGGIETTLGIMLRQSERRIDDATRDVAPDPCSTAEAAAQQEQHRPPPTAAQAKLGLKARVALVEAKLRNERAARRRAEEELAEVRAAYTTTRRPPINGRQQQ